MRTIQRHIQNHSSLQNGTKLGQICYLRIDPESSCLCYSHASKNMISVPNNIFENYHNTSHHPPSKFLESIKIIKNSYFLLCQINLLIPIILQPSARKLSNSCHTDYPPTTKNNDCHSGQKIFIMFLHLADLG